MGLGVLEDLKGNQEGALEHMATALLQNPHHEDTLLMMATVLKKMGRHEEADTCLVQLLERNPKHVEAWEERVDNMQALEAHEQALILLDNAFEHVPTHLHSAGVQTIRQPVRVADGWGSLALARPFAPRRL